MSVKCIPPSTPLLYRKAGVAGVCPYFFILIHNIHSGYLLELPSWGSSNVNPKSLFCAKIRKISIKFYSKFSIFYTKNLCILHGYVFVM